MVVAPGLVTSIGSELATVAADDEDGHRRVLQAAASTDGGTGVVYAWATALGADADPAEAERLGAGAPLALLHALAGTDTRLWLVTSGAQAVGDRPVHASQALLWGLGRVAACEQPALRVTLVDLDPDTLDVVGLVAELRAGDEPQVALRDGDRQVARLVRAQPAARRAPVLVRSDVHRLAATTPGTLEGVVPVAATRRRVGPDEVEVQIEAGGLNFIDVLKALGEYPGLESSPDLALGAECAGRIVAVGDEVTDLAVGDEVVAITPSYESTAMLASHVTVPAMFVARRPPRSTRPAPAPSRRPT